MKRNEFYIDVLLEKENISDVYSAVEESSWDDEETKKNIEGLVQDAPEDIKRDLELQRKFAEVQKTISKN